MRKFITLYLAAILIVLGLAFYVSTQDEKAAQQAKRDSAERNLPVSNPSGGDGEQTKGKESKPEEHAPSWYRFGRWPDGTTVWVVTLTLIAVVYQSQLMREQGALQAAAMQQWVDIEPRGVSFVDSPYEIRLKFAAVNNTAYLLTVEKTVTKVSLYADQWEVSTADMSARIPKGGEYPFYAALHKVKREDFGVAMIFTVNGVVSFIDCLETARTQEFMGMYRCWVDGRMERLNPVGAVPTKTNESGYGKNRQKTADE